MSEPYTVGMISRALKAMQTPVLRAFDPHTFHQWPVRKIVPTAIIKELVEQELAGRRG